MKIPQRLPKSKKYKVSVAGHCVSSFSGDSDFEKKQKDGWVQRSKKVRESYDECVYKKVEIIKELREENEKLKEELDTWHKALDEPVEGLENLQSGINLHFWQRCSGPWDADIEKINQN